MVKLIILYYLNIKSTHGYEIQKFIQATGLEVWAKIKSGSIYYALNKMEKNGEVELYKEETHGSKVRKIYRITEKGRVELNNTIIEELGKSLTPIGTDKFIIPITFGKVNKEEAINVINKHIKELEKTLEYWKHWNSIKITEKTLEVERISFEMTITNIENSIKWHEALKSEYDQYVEMSLGQEEMIRTVDFGDVDSMPKENIERNSDRINELKNIILNDKEKSQEALEELLKLMEEKNKNA